jgi:hypothetical protein
MKKGVELSLNFLVMLVIAIVIFGLGVRFIYNLAAEATQLKQTTIDELDKKIGNLLCESTDKVCIGVERKVIEKGKFDVFGVKVLNIFKNEAQFLVEVSRPTTPGYAPNKDPILDDKLYWKHREEPLLIEKNGEKEVAIGIEVPSDATSGTYIFDVRVQPYNTLHKLYVEVP